MSARGCHIRTIGLGVVQPALGRKLSLGFAAMTLFQREQATKEDPHHMVLRFPGSIIKKTSCTHLPLSPIVRLLLSGT